jgi:hypothetical protein
LYTREFIEPIVNTETAPQGTNAVHAAYLETARRFINGKNKNK